MTQTTPNLKGHELSFCREQAYESLCRAAVEYESPSNLLKFSSKTTNMLNQTGPTTLNSSKKMENNENDPNADSTSKYLRTPKEKILANHGACDNEFANSAIKLLNSVSPFINKK